MRPHPLQPGSLRRTRNVRSHRNCARSTAGAGHLPSTGFPAALASASCSHPWHIPGRVGGPATDIHADPTSAPGCARSPDSPAAAVTCPEPCCRKPAHAHQRTGRHNTVIGRPREDVRRYRVSVFAAVPPRLHLPAGLPTLQGRIEAWKDLKSVRKPIRYLVLENWSGRPDLNWPPVLAGSIT